MITNSDMTAGTVQITGTGEALPRRMVASSEIDQALGKDRGWLESACGVATRPKVSDGETQEGMAVSAARDALAAADIDAKSLDLILFGAAVGRQPIPATAPLIKRELGLESSPIPAYDINATCLSALVAMDVASLHLQAKRAKRVLVVASEIASRGLPWEDDPATAGLFGDGAGAIVMESRGEAQPLRLNHVAMETWAEGYDSCTLAAGGTRFDYEAEREAFEENSVFRMDGHSLFRLSRKRVPDFIFRLLKQTGWTTDDVDVVVPHQASPLALEHMIRTCGFSADRVINTVRETGNLVAASLPITLHRAIEMGRIKAGSRILMVGTSAGISIGGATLTA